MTNCLDFYNLFLSYKLEVKKPVCAKIINHLTFFVCIGNVHDKKVTKLVFKSFRFNLQLCVSQCISSE